MKFKRGLPTPNDGERFDGYRAYDHTQMLQLITRNMEIIRREQERGSRIDPAYLTDLEEEYAKLLEQARADNM